MSISDRCFNIMSCFIKWVIWKNWLKNTAVPWNQISSARDIRLNLFLSVACNLQNYLWDTSTISKVFFFEKIQKLSNYFQIIHVNCKNWAVKQRCLWPANDWSSLHYSFGIKPWLKSQGLQFTDFHCLTCTSHIYPIDDLFP